MKGVVIGGVSSGVGKTVATLAVIRALTAAGAAVQPAKAGPDFIDPSHHEAVAGRPSRTLDLWLEGGAGMRRNVARGTADVCVVEGVMGLYDGECSSTAMVAEALDLPVVLVVDASAGMESVAATAYGFRAYAERIDSGVDVTGVIAQRAHGGRHERGIREALPAELSYLGRIPPSEDLEIPDRHLGLEMGSETTLPREALAAAAEHLKTDRLLEIAREPRGVDADSSPADGTSATNVTDATVAVASDAAFCFRYPATVERLRERASVRTFSPVAGDPVPECDAVYLPGGYPELHAAALAASPTLEALGERAADGLSVFGECGGLMAMSRSLTTVDGETHAMAGILPADVRMCERYQALDHTEMRAVEGTLTAGRGGTLRGHEFHYSRASVDDDARFAFEMRRGEGIADGHDGLLAYDSLGTYGHVHPESGAFDHLLDRLG